MVQVWPCPREKRVPRHCRKDGNPRFPCGVHFLWHGKEQSETCHVPWCDRGNPIFSKPFKTRLKHLLVLRHLPSHEVSEKSPYWSRIYFERFVINERGNSCITKGQLISKRFISGRGFSQKTNKKSSHTSKNEFIRSFFGRILGLTICFRSWLTFNENLKFRNYLMKIHERNNR